VKGVVFNLLESVVSAAHGADAWDDLLDAAGVSGAYTSLGNYDDAELEALLAAAARSLGQEREDVLRWFGRQAMPALAAACPDFFTPHTSSRPFVAGVNDIIHAEVRKLYPGAACPHFGLFETEEGGLILRYQSPRRMCALAEGFLQGAADWYGETIDVSHTRCVSHGDSHCELNVGWLSASEHVRAA
jgi:hypothetical protein